MVIAHALLAVCATMLMAAGVQAMREEPMDFTAPSEACKPDMTSCEFWLYIRAALTMVHAQKMTVPFNGKVYFHSPTNNYTGATPVALSDVITADGYPDSRLLYLVNGSFPGPTLTVYPGQNITIYVFNHLMDSAISMHFHGIVQMGTPYSDGVGFVTQCPIQPGQSFSYNFKITQLSGTYWYHSHVGSQRTMGMYGALIIKNRPLPNMPEPEEYVMMLQDYNHDWDSEMSYYKMVYGMYKGTKKFNTNFIFQSGLINGLGRFHDPAKKYAHNGAPLARFKVKKGNSYRFRLISAGTMYALRFSIDGHGLKVVATDGHEVDPVVVQFIHLNPGERYDFMLEANQASTNYMIRAETLEVGPVHIMEAILNYEGVDSNEEPSTKPRTCTVSTPCKALNCPTTFKYHPKGRYNECLGIDKLRGREGKVPKVDGSSFKHLFLNFAQPTWKDWSPASVNGRVFRNPTVSPLTQPNEMHWGCDPKQCGEEKVCACTYHVDINYGDTVQMVFMNMGVGRGWAHPVHLHGHSFYVVKEGLAEYNHTTGKMIGDNLDIDCHGNPDRKKSLCNAATWSDSTWVGDSIPGINLERPPLKDTVNVPTGGYVVVRFKAENPGVWLMHCHTENHNLDGMSMLVREAADRIPKPPKNFPTCRSFSYDEDDVPEGPQPTEKPEDGGNKDGNGNSSGKGGTKEDFNYRDAFWACAGALISLVVTLLVISIIYLCCCRKRKTKRPLSSNRAKYFDNGGLTGDDGKVSQINERF
ncbi:uncharacterized protein LOC135497272 isoform X2 [Lineus longissimus]|uniref:uncharacterized protein LOC135497272 isoform X2 n=1 Tax=Lineus longissimus TaxID=88925 RepID=UPI002B4C823F